MANQLNARRLNKQTFLSAAVLSTIIVLFFFIFTTIALHRYWQYAAWQYDFGIFYSAIAAVAQDREPIIDHYVFAGKNILADHFHPIIFVISPFLLLYGGGETLLVMQVLFVALSGFFVYFTAKELLQSEVESFATLLIYFSFIGLHNALITEFHELALLPLPLSIFFYGMVKKKLSWFILGFVGVLLTKETLFVIPIWFGLLMALKQHGKWQQIGVATVLFAALYGFVVITFVIPYFLGGEYYYLRSLSSEYASTHSVFRVDSLSRASIFKTFASFGFIPLLSPETLVPVLSNWVSRIARHGNFDLGMHYNAEIAPTLILSFMYGWKRLQKVVTADKYLKCGIVFLAISCLMYSSLIFKSPLLLFTNKAFYRHTQNFVFLDTLIAAIPKEGSVMAQTNLAAKIANREQVYMLRDNYAEFSPDYIVFDARSGQEPNNFFDMDDFEATVARIELDPNYELFYDQGEQKIYKKISPALGDQEQASSILN